MNSIVPILFFIGVPGLTFLALRRAGLEVWPAIYGAARVLGLCTFALFVLNGYFDNLTFAVAIVSGLVLGWLAWAYLKT